MSESVALTDVYRKTAAGLQQLSHRNVKLPGVARTALIIVDGIKPVSELHAQLGGMGDVDVALGTLELAGFIEIVGAGGASAASAAPPPAVPAAAPAAAPAPAVSAAVPRPAGTA